MWCHASLRATSSACSKLHSLSSWKSFGRTFLSPAFHCEVSHVNFPLILMPAINVFVFQSEYQGRLSSPALSKLDLNRFFVDVERKFNNEKRGSAIDIDLFANKV